MQEYTIVLLLPLEQERHSTDIQMLQSVLLQAQVEQA